MWDEEHIALSLEKIGHDVHRIDENARWSQIINEVIDYKPDFVLFAKFRVANADLVMKEFRKNKIKTVCWVFDLYFGYNREYQLRTAQMFKADYVFTTDGGHQENFRLYDIKHGCIRQGIYDDECVLMPSKKEYDVIFVGSMNPYNRERNNMLSKIDKDYNFQWFGKADTNEVRGLDLNRLYGKSKIVVGDSVYSPHYWSNRIVETLGRGGFLIHQEVEGLKEEYPYLVTYKRGDYDDLKSKIDYYLTHTKERNAIIKKNYEWVLNNYTCSKQCEKLCQSL